MKFAEKYGGVYPNVKLGGKFGKDGSFFNSTSRGGGVLDGFHDGRIAADIGEDAADLGEAIETGGALSAIRKDLDRLILIQNLLVIKHGNYTTKRMLLMQRMDMRHGRCTPSLLWIMSHEPFQNRIKPSQKCRRGG